MLARRVRQHLFPLLVSLVALAAAGCTDDGDGNGPDENSSPILDGFDSGGEPSPCQGVTVSPGGACSLPTGSFCSTTVQCACFPTTRTIGCECAGGTWVCPEDCANEQPPCPADDVVDPTDVTDVSDAEDTIAGDVTDTTVDDTSMTDTPVDDTGMDDTAMPDMAMNTNALTATASTLDDLATRVTVDSVTADESGWVVVSAGATVLGQTAVPAGTTTQVEVDLTRRAGDGESLTATLHVDLGAAGTWEPGTDVEATDGAGATIEAMFAVTVPAALPDARLTVTSPGDAAWDFTGEEPSTVSIVGGEASNQTLTLTTGWRYEIVDQGTLTLELVDGTGVVLLSEAGGGSLASDTEVAWTTGSGTVTFTVDSDLAAALAGYRDATTPAIAGAVTIVP